MAQPSGWQLCTTDWVKIEGAISEGRATEMTMAGERERVIKYALGGNEYLNDKQYRAALKALKHTIRKVYTNSANTSQFNAALRILKNNINEDEYTKVAETCYLCGQRIFVPKKFRDAGVGRPSDCLGYPEAEHVLPLKMGHKLLSIPGQKIDGEKDVNNKNPNTYSNKQVILEMKNSHRLCNQIKSNIMFIKFTGGQEGRWELKNNLITEFGRVVERCMNDRNKAQCENAGAESDATVSTVTMEEGLNAVCNFLNDEARPPKWNVTPETTKERLAFNSDILLDAKSTDAPTWWNTSLGYIMYRYATKIARSGAGDPTIEQLLKDTWTKYGTDQGAKIANQIEDDGAIKELQSQSQSITQQQQPDASEFTEYLASVQKNGAGGLDTITEAEETQVDNTTKELLDDAVDNTTKELLKNIKSIIYPNDPIQMVENIIEKEEAAEAAEVAWEDAAEGGEAEAAEAAWAEAEDEVDKARKQLSNEAKKGREQLMSPPTRADATQVTTPLGTFVGSVGHATQEGTPVNLMTQGKEVRGSAPRPRQPQAQVDSFASPPSWKRQRSASEAKAEAEAWVAEAAEAWAAAAAAGGGGAGAFNSLVPPEEHTGMNQLKERRNVFLNLFKNNNKPRAGEIYNNLSKEKREQANEYVIKGKKSGYNILKNLGFTI